MKLSNLVVYIKSIRENLSIQITEKKGMCRIFVYTDKKNCGSIFGIFVYTKNKDLRRRSGSDSKIVIS